MSRAPSIPARYALVTVAVVVAGLVAGCGTTVSPSPTASLIGPTIPPTPSAAITATASPEPTGSPGPTLSGTPQDMAFARGLLEARSFSFTDAPLADGTPHLVGRDEADQIQAELFGDPLTGGSVVSTTNVLVDADVAGRFGGAIGVIVASLGAGDEAIQWIVDQLGGAMAGPVDAEQAFGDLVVHVLATSVGRIMITLTAGPA